MRTKYFIADGVGLAVALDALGLHVLDHASHVGVGEAARFEDRADLRPGGAHLVAHAALHDDALRPRVELRRGVTGEISADAALQSHRERIARVVEPGEVLRLEEREIHAGVNMGMASLNTTRTAAPMARRSKSQSTRLVSMVTPSSSVT